jgi:deoxyribodipyrimidine photo-lyase
MKKTLVWFRNDLRLHDHEPLTKALSRSEAILPVFIFDPRWFENTSLGFPRTDRFRAKFLLESVTELRKNIEAKGGKLLVRVGKPEEILPELAEKHNVTAVYSSKEVTSEETQTEEKLEKQLWKNKVGFEMFWGTTLFHPDDLPYPIKNLPDVFTDFRKEAEKTVKARASFATPARILVPPDVDTGEMPTLEDLGLTEGETDTRRSVLAYRGGENEGLKRLDDYLWQKNLLKTYKETRNGMLGGDYSSKFSAWLALGCLSPRKIYEEIRLYERERIKNDSTYWLIFELIWRDYFRFVAKKYGNRIFNIEGIQNRQGLRWIENERLFDRWKEGETGVPFIDANMRELKLTGFMSNRGRQNVASFLSKDLKINWIWGAMWFESLLIDHDVCSNWCNWNYVAGVGNDPRENRYFNITTQALRYDPQAEYVKHWLPELAEVPPKKIHQLADLPITEQKKYNVIVGVDYPQPVVNPNKWLKEA